MTARLEPLLTGILSAAASRINDQSSPPSLIHLVPGALPAWDDCCAGGGQMYLRIVEVFPTAGQGPSGAPFPQFDTAQRGVGCGITVIALHLAVGVIRCVHTLDDHGTPPTAAQMNGDALAIADDLAVLLDFLACDLPSVPGVMAKKVGRWTPQGAQGGCGGGEWDFYVAADPCLCQPVPEPDPEPVE